MYETETTHLHPSLKRCPICQAELKECYRKKQRCIRMLKEEKHIVSHIYRCERKECQEAKVKIEPEEESKLVLKYCHFGLDVTLEIGMLRQRGYKTRVEIQKELYEKYKLKISEREVDHQNNTYLTLVNMVMRKENSKEWSKLKELKGLVLAIDGIKPDMGDDVLFLIREVQTGYVIAAKMLDYTSKDELAKLIRKVKEMPFEILGVVSDGESLVRKAINEELPNVPYQLCQYHFLKQLGKKIKKEDGKVKKNFIADDRTEKKSK